MFWWWNAKLIKAASVSGLRDRTDAHQTLRWRKNRLSLPICYSRWGKSPSCSGSQTQKSICPSGHAFLAANANIYTHVIKQTNMHRPKRVHRQNGWSKLPVMFEPVHKSLLNCMFWMCIRNGGSEPGAELLQFSASVTHHLVGYPHHMLFFFFRCYLCFEFDGWWTLWQMMLWGSDTVWHLNRYPKQLDGCFFMNAVSFSGGDI